MYQNRAWRDETGFTLDPTGKPLEPTVSKKGGKMTLGKKFEEAFKFVLDDLRENGFEFPIRIAAISKESHFINIIFHDWNPEKGYVEEIINFPKAQEKGTYHVFPLNMFVLDRSGRSAHVVFETEFDKTQKSDIIYH